MTVKMIGTKWARLEILARYPKQDKDKAIYYICHCDCGNFHVTKGTKIRIGEVNSCGCLSRENSRRVGKQNTTHGMTKSRTYNSYVAMKERCYNTKNASYGYYGSRGVIVCDRWLQSFENFLEDMGERLDGHTLDRIDVNGNYEKSNCRWATSFEQANNKRKNRY